MVVCRVEMRGRLIGFDVETVDGEVTIGSHLTMKTSRCHNIPLLIINKCLFSDCNNMRIQTTKVNSGSSNDSSNRNGSHTT